SLRRKDLLGGARRGDSGVRGAAGGDRVIEPLPGTVEPLLAPSGEHLPALPQTDRVLEPALSGFQAAHHLDELVAGRLVGQLGDVRGQRLRPLGGGDGAGRCLVGVALDGGEVVVGAAVRGHRGSSVGSDGTDGDGCAGSDGTDGDGAGGADGCGGGVRGAVGACAVLLGGGSGGPRWARAGRTGRAAQDRTGRTGTALPVRTAAGAGCTGRTRSARPRSGPRPPAPRGPGRSRAGRGSG